VISPVHVPHTRGTAWNCSQVTEMAATFEPPWAGVRYGWDDFFDRREARAASISGRDHRRQLFAPALRAVHSAA
jgi:hypothetical protein